MSELSQILDGSLRKAVPVLLAAVALLGCRDSGANKVTSPRTVAATEATSTTPTTMIREPRTTVSTPRNDLCVPFDKVLEKGQGTSVTDPNGIPSSAVRNIGSTPDSINMVVFEHGPKNFENIYDYSTRHAIFPDGLSLDIQILPKTAEVVEVIGQVCLQR